MQTFAKKRGANTGQYKPRSFALMAAVALLGGMANMNLLHADTLLVTSTADDGTAGTMRAALYSAVDGDIIDATGISGTIFLTGGELVVDDDVSIIGPGPASLTVDAQFASRVFHIAPGLTVTIDGLAIVNGLEGQGGGIYNLSFLTVNNSTLSGNSARYGGGGIFNGGSLGSATLIVNNSTISGNSASAGANGGGILNDGIGGGYATLIVNNSTISDNSAGAYGGGIYSIGGVLTVNNSTISGNNAYDAGGIYNYADVLTVNNSTLSGNLAWTIAAGSGGIYNYQGVLTVNNSTFSGNSADIFSRGIGNYGEFSRLEIRSSILLAGIGRNISASGNGIVHSYGFNLSSDDGGGILNGPNDRINIDPLLGPLADNGGPTLTHLPQPGSPAIDGGSSERLIASGITTDQRGFARTVDDPTIANAPSGDGTDIGAVEVQTTTPVPERDIEPPVCVAALAPASPGLTSLVVEFNEPVDSLIAQDESNYGVSGVTVVRAQLIDPTKVLLTVSPSLTIGGTHQVTVFNVQDLSGNVAGPCTMPFFAPVLSCGFAVAELYFNINGVQVSDLRNATAYPNFPDLLRYRTLLELNDFDEADNYGARMSGFLIPPVSGEYDFYMSSDDSGEFWLSTDANPANIVRLAYEPVWNGRRDWLGVERRNAADPENRSSGLFPDGIPMVAGQMYYFEALMKEGGGGDHMAVAWRPPGHLEPANGSSPIPGSSLASLASPIGASLVIDQQPIDQTFLIGLGAPHVTFSVIVAGSTATDIDPPIFYQWYRDDGSGFAPIPGANSASLTFAPTQADDGSHYSVVICIPGATIVSDSALLTVRQSLPGDLNLDCCLNRLDLDLLLFHIRGRSSDLAYDLNGDGAVNIADARWLVLRFTDSGDIPCECE